MYVAIVGFHGDIAKASIAPDGLPRNPLFLFPAALGLRPANEPIQGIRIDLG